MIVLRLSEAGKLTLMYSLSGMDRPTDGSVRFAVLSIDICLPFLLSELHLNILESFVIASRIFPVTPLERRSDETPVYFLICLRVHTFLS